MARLEPRTIYMGRGNVVVLRADLDDPDAFIPKGTVLTCKDGHQVATVVNSIGRWQMVDRHDFDPPPELVADEPHPLRYALPPRCSVCGGLPIQFGEEWTMNRRWELLSQAIMGAGR